MAETIYRNHQDVPGLIVAHNTITEENENDLVLWAKMFHGGRYFQSSSDGHFSCESDQFHPIVKQILAGVGVRMMPDLVSALHLQPHPIDFLLTPSLTYSTCLSPTVSVDTVTYPHVSTRRKLKQSL